MKVLIITGCVYAQNCGRNNFTGLDYIVGEISEKIGEICDVNIYTLTSYPETSIIKNAKIISYTNRKLLKYINVKDMISYLKFFIKNKNSVKSTIKAIRAFLISKDIDLLCKKNKYDIIHIHGATFSNLIAARAAEKNKIPVLFTLHGLISFGAPNISNINKKAERLIIKTANRKNRCITCVSTGVKENICDENLINVNNINNVILINNAINFKEELNADYCYKRFGINLDKKIIISVGTICDRKNQIQLIRAYEKLPKDIRNKYVVLLAGKDSSNGVVKDYIEKHNLNKDVIICGFLSKKELSSLYKASSFNVMLSVSEGFGLSMIEASYFGIPTLTFDDLDAVKDIYYKESMILMSSRDDYSVTEGLIQMINHRWNKSEIMKSVSCFNEEIYLNYYNLYNHIIENNMNILDKGEINSLIGFDSNENYK